GNFAGEGSLSESESTQYTNSQLLANNIRLEAKGDATIRGADIHAEDKLEIVAENLDISSVQNLSSTETHSQGMSYSGAGTGANAAEGYHEILNTQVTRLTGRQVDISVADHTNLEAAVIASVDSHGADNGQLRLSTETLSASSLNNTVDNENRSLGILGGQTSTLEYLDETRNSRTKSLATLGSGDIQINDTKRSETRFLNTDITDTEVAIFDIGSHQGLSGELDVRLLSDAGRKEIAEDWLKTRMIGNTIELVATTERVGIEDFFSETEKHHTTYETIKQQIYHDPQLADALQNPSLSAEQKELMLNRLVNAVMLQLGYESYENKIIATDSTGRDGQQIFGFYSTETGNAYINDKNIDDTTGLVTTAGHEATRAMDHQQGVDFNENREDRTKYAQNYGESFASYTGQSLSMAGYEGGLADSNDHLGNTDYNVKNNAESFVKLDKNQGDNYLKHDDSLQFHQLIDALFDCGSSGDCTEQYKSDMQREVAQLLKEDYESDARLRAACQSASSDACRAEVSELREAFYSYKNLPNGKVIFQDGTLSEYVDVARQYGEYRSEGMSDNAKRALVSLPVDTFTGMVELATVVTKAAQGNKESQQQLSNISESIQSFVSDPVGTIESSVKVRLEEADRQEALGNINKAEEIRSKIILEGAFAVTGTTNGAISLVRTGLGVPKLDNKIQYSSVENELKQVNPELETYRELVGVGADGAQIGLPINYTRVVAPNGDIVIQGPRKGIYEQTDFIDKVGNPLYLNSGKLYSMDGRKEYVPKSYVSKSTKKFERFDEAALQGQYRQEKMLIDNQGFNITGFEDEINHPSGTLGNPLPWNPDNLPGTPEGGSTFLTDKASFIDAFGDLEDSSSIITVTKSQLRTLETNLGLQPGILGTGSVIRQFENIRSMSPASPLGLAGNEFFRGPGFHLSDGAPEVIINPAQNRINNTNIIRSWIIEVTE
ncbi:MAG: hypothetical protein GY806_01340, partial [Gammaproteobacteria bacterium]|nr:hypothetical protein [Gammaproteobacteria bacterium]